MARYTSRYGMLLLAGAALWAASPRARADDYTDLLDILRAKGSLTQAEYDGLLSKHLHHGARPVRAATAHARPMTHAVVVGSDAPRAVVPGVMTTSSDSVAVTQAR
ncbi:porin, partial [Ameyamaea chiangmaiensis]|nr:porin [Ameyamaea chiangmaiensis]